MNPDDPYVAIARRLGGRLLERHPLTGGVSANVQALRINRPDDTHERIVVRQHRLDGPHAVAPHVTAAEYALLTALADRGLPVPRPLLLDESCALLPGPFVVLPFVEGRTDLTATELPGALAQMADFLARLHRLDVALAPPTLPRRTDPAPGALRYLPDDRRLAPARRLLENHSPPDSPHALLHGDFWAGNLMWRDGRLAAVLDWEDAAVGDPLCDVAGARVELAWKFGADAGATLVRLYGEARGAAADDRALARWELYVASAGLTYMGTWGLDPALEAHMRRSHTACLFDAARRLTGG